MVALAMYSIVSLLLFVLGATLVYIGARWILDYDNAFGFYLVAAGIGVGFAAFHCGDKALKIAEVISNITLP